MGEAKNSFICLIKIISWFRTYLTNSYEMLCESCGALVINTAGCDACREPPNVDIEAGGEDSAPEWSNNERKSAHQPGPDEATGTAETLAGSDSSERQIATDSTP